MKNLNVLFILGSSAIIFLIALYTFGESKKSLEMKKSEFLAYEGSALKFHNYYENYSNLEGVENKLKTILTKLNIQKFDMTRDNKTVLLYVENISTGTLGELLNELLNQKLNIIKLDIKKDKIIVEVGIV